MTASRVRVPQVTLHDVKGSVIARGTTDAQGIAGAIQLHVASKPGGEDDDNGEGYVAVTRRRMIARCLPVRDGDPDLAPWRFDLQSAWGNQRAPLAGCAVYRTWYLPSG